MIYKLHSVCRACGNSELVPVLSLGSQPLANAFTPEPIQHTLFPLEVLYCDRCTLGQLSVVVDANELYPSSYKYVQSHSETMVQHFDALAGDILMAGGRGPVLEIGSNDGSFLTHLRTLGFVDVVGMDPAASGIEPSVKEQFNVNSAIALEQESGFRNLIIGRHVFAHIDDWDEFIKAINHIAFPDALIVIEVPYAPDMLANNLWSLIYSEHLSYVTERSVRAVLKGSGFAIQRVIHYSVHGGSVVFLIKRGEDTKQFSHEEDQLQKWKQFSVDCHANQVGLKMLLMKLRLEGKSICGYGAPAKATVICNAIQLSTRHLDFVTDTTPCKVGCTIPGTDIPIVEPDKLLEKQPDYALLLAWNYPEILDNESVYRARGGKFIMPHSLKVL